MNVIRAYCLWTPITSVLLKEKQNQIEQALDTARQLFLSRCQPRAKGSRRYTMKRSKIWVGFVVMRTQVCCDQGLYYERNRKVKESLGVQTMVSGSLSSRHGASSDCGWRNGFQIWRVDTNILNTQSRAADREWSLGVGRGTNNSSPWKRNM